jgi:hypothetical protein
MMKLETSRVQSFPRPERRLSRWTMVLTVLALLTGAVVAFAVNQVGAISLLAVPALLLFLAVIGQPDIGLAGLIFITFTQLSNVGIVTFGLPSITQPLAAMLFLLILIRITLYREQPVGWLRAGPILGIYVLIWFISLLHANDFTVALTGFIGFVKDALGAVIVVYLIQKLGSFRVAFWTLILTGLFLGAITTYQGLTGASSDSLFGFGTITNQISGDLTRERLSGPYGNPNAYAQILIVLVPLALDRLWHEKRFVLRIVAGLSAIVNIIAIFYTYSRNGFVSMVFAVGLLFAQRRPNIVPWLVTLALGFAIIQFVPSTFTDRLSTLLQFASPSEQITDASFRGRLSENLAAWNMFQDNPLLGVGLGNFRVNYQAYSREIGLDDRRTTRTPANLYLELLSEQGLVGTAIFFLLMYIVVKNLLTASRQFKLHGMITEAYMSTAILSGFAGYMFAAINKNSAYSNVFWLLIGIMLSAYQVAQSVHEEKLVGVDPHPGVRE